MQKLFMIKWHKMILNVKLEGLRKGKVTNIKIHFILNFNFNCFFMYMYSKLIINAKQRGISQ